MKYPQLAEMQTARERTDVFLGYNHNLRIADGEFYDMKNMTGDDYPVLSPRGKRGIYLPTKDYSNFVGLIAKDTLDFIATRDYEGDKDAKEAMLYLNKSPTNLTVSLEREDPVPPETIGKRKPKQLVSMGAYIIIMPDKKFLNTNKDTEQGDVEKHFLARGNINFYPSLYAGDKIKVVKSATAPVIAEGTAAADIPYWLDTSDTPYKLKVYSTSKEEWSEISTSYVRIDAPGIGEAFSVGDTVTISNVKANGLEELNSSLTIVNAKHTDDESYIIVPGVADGSGVSQQEPVGFSRWMPDMDFVIESQNRLWGCRYGQAYLGYRYDPEKDSMQPYYGNYVNQIYCSALGDFKNWQTNQFIASDSYTVSVGTDGVFTGAVTHNGYPIFFKENFLHKVYGNYPANYQVQTTACRGVQRGCDRSLAIVNEVAYYKSRSGIMAYDGSLPTEVSAALGDKSYSDARAGYLGNKYYVSMKDDDTGEYSMFVLDTKKGMWHREDNTEAVMFSNCRGNLYYIDYATDSVMAIKPELKEDGKSNEESDDVEWETVSGLIGTDSPDKKYVSRLDVRMKLVPGATVSFYADYDSLGSWEHLFTMTGVDLKSFSVPVKPKRCDHMRLKIVGRGEAKIFSIYKTVEWGSDN